MMASGAQLLKRLGELLDALLEALFPPQGQPEPARVRVPAKDKPQQLPQGRQRS